MKDFKLTKGMIISAAIIFSCVIILFSSVKNNDSGFRTHVQTPSGHEYVRFEPGWFFVVPFSKTTEYPNVITTMYTDDEDVVGVTALEQPFEIRFNDATKSQASATVRWRLPNSEEDMILVHKEYGSPEKLAQTTLSKYSRECLKYAAQLMESETHYSGGMAKLSEDFQDQLEHGQYVLELKTEYVIDTVSGEQVTLTTNYIRRDPTTGLAIRNISDVQQFGITVSYASVDQIDYEPIVDEKLAAKIEQSTRESISKQALITAKQEALTAIEEGKKLIAQTEAKENAEKLKSVIQAEKEKEVAEQEALQAKFIADKIEEEGRAEAAKNQALVLAGLTPQEKAEWDYKTAVGVAEALAKADMPEIVVSGGNGNSNPLDAIGIKFLLDIQSQLKK